MGQPKFEDDVAAFDIADIVEPLLERIDHRRPLGFSRGQDADARDFRWALLSRTRQRHASHECNRENESSHALHSMTSSARPRINGGIVRPSPSAVLRLTTKSNFNRLLNRQIGGLGPLQDAVDIARRSSEIVRYTRAVGHQAAIVGIFALGVHGARRAPLTSAMMAWRWFQNIASGRTTTPVVPAKTLGASAQGFGRVWLDAGDDVQAHRSRRLLALTQRRGRAGARGIYQHRHRGH